MTNLKIDAAFEQHLLNQKVQLTDGNTGHVFTRGPKNEVGVYTYNCHICGIQNLPDVCLKSHAQGRKHQTKLGLKEHEAALFRSPQLKKAKIPMDIAPGEPVPPGFENEVKPLADLQVSLDKFKLSPLIGLEYIMELQYSETLKEPSYHCVLCDKRGDPRTIMSHLTSYNHRMKYLEKHFPSIIREIGPFRFNKEAQRRHVVQEVIERVCKTIEDYHGRLTPNVHAIEDYEKNQSKILQDVIFEKHFDERTGPKFIDAIDKKAIDLFYSNITAEEIKSKVITEPDPNVIEIVSDASSISSGSFGGKSRSRSPSSKRRRYEEKLKKRIELPHMRKRPRSKSRSPVYRSKRHSRSPIIRRISRSPKRVSRSPKRKSRSPKRKSRSPKRTESIKPRVKLNHLEDMSEKTPFDKEKSKAVRCRDEIDKAVELLTRLFKEYQKSPEKHPEYNDEWKKFWNKRYKELQMEGKDPSKFDFKPEWIEFWTKRMKELHDQDIDRKVLEIKNRYKTKSQSPPRKEERARSSLRSKSRERSTKYRSKSRSTSLSSISDEEKQTRRKRHPPETYKDPYRDDYYSSHPSYTAYNYGYSYYPPYGAPPAYFKGSDSAVAKPVEKSPPKEEDDVNETITFVSVMRLICALEDHLGNSLGPKCVDLLSKALALEKIKANSAEESLMTDELCVLLETVKEKLKGIMAANIARENEKPALKKAVRHIASLIHMHSEKKKNLDKKQRRKRTPEEENLETRIRSALIVQGRTDLSDDDIDLLLDVFLDMASQYPPNSKTQFTVKQYLTKNKHIEDESKPVIESGGSGALESLTDSDLQTLLQNFKDLSSEEQQQLITYLKKLELTDPDRVKKLRSYCVGIEEGTVTNGKSLKSQDDDEMDFHIVEDSPKRVVSEDPRLGGQPATKSFDEDIFFEDEEDDEYTYEDLIRSSKQNTDPRLTTTVEETSNSIKDDQESRDSNSLLISKLGTADTQNLIANLMGSLQQSIQQTSSAKPTTQTNNNQTSYSQYVAQSSYSNQTHSQSQQTTQSSSLFPIQALSQQNTIPIQTLSQQNTIPIQQNNYPSQPLQQPEPPQQKFFSYQSFAQKPAQQQTFHTSYVRQGQVNPWTNQGQNQQQQQPQSMQQNPQHQQQQHQQHQNTLGNQPFYQWYRN